MKNLTLGNIYIEPHVAPPLTFDQIMQEILAAAQGFDNTRLVLGGDFNAVLDPILDCHYSANYYRQPSVLRGDKLNGILDHMDLTDVWRTLHPEERRFTFHSGTTNRAMSQLDYFFVSPDMLTSVLDSIIGIAYRSDHSPTYLQFSLQDNQPGRGLWRLPNFVLSDPQYCALITHTIQELVYLNQDSNPAVLWETIKACIRGDTIRYLSQKKQEKKGKIEELEAEIFQSVMDRDRFLGRNEDLASHYSSKVAFLQIELNDVFEAQNALARQYYAARKYYCWERSNKYFFSLPGKKYDTIKYLRTPQGSWVKDSQELLEEGTRFYTQLYTKEAAPRQEDPKLNDYFLRLIPVEKMSYKGYQILSQTITVDDLHSSLSAMKLNKVSGPDGLNVEFYRAFWPLIGKIVHASLMYGQQYGKLSDSQRRGVL